MLQAIRYVFEYIFKCLNQLFSFNTHAYPQHSFIALYVDCENINNLGYLQVGIEELTKIGTIKFKRFYGDFEGHHKTLLPFIQQIKAQTIHLPKIKHKNYADIKIVVDIMDIIHKYPDITHIAIMSNDSDFDPVIKRIKRAKRYSIGLITHDSTNHPAFDYLINLQNPNSDQEGDRHDHDMQKIIYILKRYHDQYGWVSYKKLLSILKTFSLKKDWNSICKEKIKNDDRFFTRTNLEGNLIALRMHRPPSDNENKYIIRKVIQSHNRKHNKMPQDYVTLKRVRAELKRLGYSHLNDSAVIRAIIHANPKEFFFEESGNWVKILI